MRSSRSANFSALLAAGLLAFYSARGLSRSYTLPWPSLSTFHAGPQALQDLSMVMAGFRRLAADMAWVQMLQYMGTSWHPPGEPVEEAHESHHHDFEDNGPKQENAYGDLKEMTLRIAWLDPHFKEAYLYAAGILAWSPMIDRPEEASDLLRQGMLYNPDYWPFKTYMAAILYKKHEQTGDMTRILEESIRQPDCPTMVKFILANYYRSQKRYGDAIRIWEGILRDPKETIHYPTANLKLEQLYRLISAR